MIVYICLENLLILFNFLFIIIENRFNLASRLFNFLSINPNLYIWNNVRYWILKIENIMVYIFSYNLE